MPKKTAPERVVLTKKQMRELEERIRKKNINDNDVIILLGQLSFDQWVYDQLSRAKLTIKRLKGLFGFKSESRNNTETENNETGNENKESNEEDLDTKNLAILDQLENEQSNDKGKKNWDPLANHGRYGAAKDYPGCLPITIPCQDKKLIEGKCPDCSDHQGDVNLSSVTPRFVVILESAPLIHGDRYELEKSRCSICSKYFTASLPENIKKRKKYSHQCLTSIAIFHYYGGLPFKRLEMLQAAQGVPLPDATQYDLMNKFYKKDIKPISRTLRRYAANGETLFFDDTPGRILEQMQFNKTVNKASEKSSIHATAIVSEYESHRIYLFETNKKTAGKQLKDLLSKRTTNKKFKTMSDASSSNFPLLDDNLMARWVISLCLTHGRRRFVELLDGQDEDLVFILDLISKVYINERYCKENNLNPDERLAYHQQHSGPVMGAMFTWFNNLLLFKEVEPNSQFGAAILYMIKHWEGLTEFLRTPGAALDNNICEQAIKVMIRYRKNSLFYRTFYGASIGDAMMSVIHTTINAGENIFDYMNALQKNSKNVNDNPEKWLPWCYRQTLLEKEKVVPETMDTS